MLKQLLKLLIRTFCHHTYYQEFKLYGRNIEHNKEVVFGMVERGERNPALVNIEIFANAFDLSLSELFDFRGKNETS